jgi:hypothetical protein
VACRQRFIDAPPERQLERVLACSQAQPERWQNPNKLRQSLDPFQLGKTIDQNCNASRIWRIGG